MVIAALLLATAASATMTATPVRATTTKLRLSPSAVASQITAESSAPHRRSRYLLPQADSAAQGNDGIRFRWKLNKVKMTMPIPSI